MGESDSGTLRWVVRLVLAAASVAAAGAHFSVAGEHFQEYWLFGVFFLVTAWLQIAWAVAVLLQPRRWVLAWGAVLQLGIVAVWVLSRTGGVPVGPEPSTPEAVGWLDALTTGLEVFCAVGALGLMRWRLRRPLRTVLRVEIAAVAVFAVMASTSAAVALAPAHEHDAAGHAGHEHAALPPLRIATTSAAGPITLPDHQHQHTETGVAAFGNGCEAEPTAAQQQEAKDLVDRTVAADSKYASLAAAKADGFRPITPSGLPVVHYLSVRNFAHTMQTGNPLDPQEPQSLVYANTSKGAVLVAVMYLMSQEGAQPPPTGGCLAQWHVHTNLCFAGINVVALQQAGRCPAGTEARGTPPMLHVWLVPVPGGPLAHADDADAVRGAQQVSNPNGPGSVA